MCSRRLDAARIDLDAEERGAVHGGGQRLGPAHAAQAGGERRSGPAEVAAEMPAGTGGERLVGALQDALRADVNPAAGRHLAEHRQAHRFQPAKFFPRRPLRHQQAVGDQHARGQFVRADDADRLARLHQQRFVVVELAQRGDDGVEVLPRSAPPCRSRRRRRGGRDPRPPRGRGCSSACAGRLPESSPCRIALDREVRGCFEWPRLIPRLKKRRFREPPLNPYYSRHDSNVGNDWCGAYSGRCRARSPRAC